MFRQLEEPDKLRSLNLSGFYIDEANQVSEEAFMLLQGRLRGSGIRKGIITTNPKGHDWIYRWFLQKDHINNEPAKLQYHLIKAPSTENIHLPEGYLQSMMSAWDDARIKREIEGSFDAFEGQVYSDFRRDLHVVRPFRVPGNWDRHIRIDHGFRNPAAVLFFAISPDGDVYVTREIYVREWLIKEIVKGDRSENKKGLLEYIQGQSSFKTAKIDPSTRNRRGNTGTSDYDEYVRHWPQTLPPLQMAKNDVQVVLTTEPRKFAVGPLQIEIQSFSMLTTDTTGSISPARLSRVDDVMFLCPGGPALTAAPTISNSGTVPTVSFTFADPAAACSGYAAKTATGYVFFMGR
ncbi:unnamed protein product [Sphagnum balticum]